MISVLMMTPHEMMMHIAEKAKSKRLSLNLSQTTLATKSGVSYGTLKKFERTGQISLESLLKIALILDCLEKFQDLFLSLPMQITTIDELMKDQKRMRGRR